MTADDVLIATGKKSPVKPKKAAPAGGKAKEPKPAPGPMPTGTMPMDGMQKVRLRWDSVWWCQLSRRYMLWKGMDS